MKKYLFLLLVAGATILASCTEEDTSLGNDPSRNSKNEILRTTAIITANLSSDDDLINEVYSLVDKKIYDEESALFADLLDEDNSGLKSVITSKFNNKFRSEFEKLYNLKSSDYGKDTEILKELCNGKVQLYWPYHERWDKKTRPTVSFYDGVNENENIGYTSNGTEVLVNDNYAKSNPVWIINTIEFDGDLTQLKEAFKNKQQNMKSTYLSSASLMNSTDHKYLSVIMNRVMCKVHYDGLFNGGSEFRVIRAGLIDEYHADISDWVMGCYLTRGEISDEEWVDYYSPWDTQWEKNLDYQVMGAWEYDGDNEWKANIGGQVSGAYEIKDTNGNFVKVGMNAGFSKTYDSDQSAIYSNSWGRSFSLNTLVNNARIALGDLKIEWTSSTFN